MKNFFDEKTRKITTILKVNNRQVLTGNKEGEILLWDVAKFSGEYSFHCGYPYLGHSSSIRKLALLSDEEFVSLSADNTMIIWNINTGACRKFLTNAGSVSPEDCQAMVGLGHGLLAIAGNCSPAYGCFDVWDTATGICLYRQEEYVHRPHVMELALTSHGYLAVQGHCSGQLSLWKIDRQECRLLDRCRNERIYSLAALPGGGIITGRTGLNIFKYSAEGKLVLTNSVINNNVIDTIIPLDASKVLAIDRQGFGYGSLKQWDFAAGISSANSDASSPTGGWSESQTVLLGNQLLSFGGGSFCIQKLPAFDFRLSAPLITNPFSFIL